MKASKFSEAQIAFVLKQPGLLRRRLISRNASIIRTLNPSISASKAMELAEQQAANKDAIHTLDMIAGGQL
ncbi:hypothetical protein [Rhizobium sp. No.120]